MRLLSLFLLLLLQTGTMTATTFFTGMPIENLQYHQKIAIDSYRYGYSKQLKDNEWAGKGNHYEFRYRGYNPMTGRFYASDPLFQKYPWNSTYAYAENRVIDGGDIEGLEYYYAADGRYLGKSGASQMVVVTSGFVNGVAQNAQPLNISNTVFLRTAGLAYSETGYNETAIEGLPFVIRNRINQLGKAGIKADWNEVLIKARNGWTDDEYANGNAKTKGNPAFRDFLGIKRGETPDFEKNGYHRNNNRLMMLAISSTIDALMGKSDPTDGAVGWHAEDILQSSFWTNLLYVHPEHQKFGFTSWQNKHSAKMSTFESTKIYHGQGGTTLYYKSTEYSFVKYGKKGGL